MEDKQVEARIKLLQLEKEDMDGRINELVNEVIRLRAKVYELGGNPNE